MAVQIQLRNDVAANWTSSDPILAQAELGIESDTGRIKLGDGVSSWSELSYAPLADTPTEIDGGNA